MCEELVEELQHGKELAKQLAIHLERMGNAERVTIPIITDEACYIVEVRKTF